MAAAVGSGRSGKQCRDKWKRLLQRRDESAELEQEEEEEEAEEEEQQRRQPPRAYQSWSGRETSDAAQLLGAVGARLATDGSFAQTTRSFPAKLDGAVRLGLHALPLQDSACTPVGANACM